MTYLPPSFAQDTSKIEKVSKSILPIICFRDGSPPLPDALNTSLKDPAISGTSQLGQFTRQSVLYFEVFDSDIAIILLDLCC